MKKIILSCIILLTISCKNNSIYDTKEVAIINQYNIQKPTSKVDHQIRKVKKAVIVPKLDGDMNDPVWKNTLWYGFDQRWLGPEYNFSDFFGRYKIAWTPEALYLLVEIKDDILMDQNKDPFHLWRNDDSIEIFIDADNSGGNHLYSNNAFAYCVALDGKVVDIDENKNPILLTNHIRSKRVTRGDVSVWEFEITIYDDTYKEGKVNDPVILTKGQSLGFAIAYNDNDNSLERENYIGSVFIPGVEKDLAKNNADVLGTIVLEE